MSESDKLGYYIVQNKDDDYGNCVKELVHTTLENAEQYYACDRVPDSDIEVLKKYMTLVEYDEEKERSEDRRFCGENY